MFDEENEIQLDMQQPESTQVNDQLKNQSSDQQKLEDGRVLNFRALREKAEKAERERDDALKYAREIESRFKQPISNQDKEDDDEISIGPDDLAEGRHLSKVDRKIKKLESQIKQYQQQTYDQSAETRIKSQFPDFEQVVNRDTIELLKASYPELASTLNSSTDLYATAVSAYTLIKKFGISSDRSNEAQRERVQNNMNKPRPITSINAQQGDTPMSRANAFADGLTEDLKQQLLKEMNTYRKNY